MEQYKKEKGTDEERDQSKRKMQEIRENKKTCRKKK